MVTAEDHQKFHDGLASSADDLDAFEHPHSLLLEPVFDSITSSEQEVVGILIAVIPWDKYVTKLLPASVVGIQVVLKNTCGQAFTYDIVGDSAVYLGAEDLHDTRYNHMEVQIDLARYIRPEIVTQTPGHCMYSFSVFPSDKYFVANESKTPLYFTMVVASTFFLMAFTFFVYDRFVQRRNIKVLDAAARSNMIVSSLFPSNVRDRLFQNDASASKKTSIHAPAKSQLKNFLTDDGESGESIDEESEILKTKPIADLFPETTILFADIAGFTAWSSMREPAQVFTLLETLYRAFDSIAKRRNVFKVETVGDC